MANKLSDKELQRTFAELGFISGSSSMLPILRQAQRAASMSDITVLVEGETGTGKEVLAHAIHRLDDRRRSFPFVTIHCSTINEALAESEFFGHAKGAFSGALNGRKGLFQSAQGGTILLDDVNDLPGSLQPKLLDVLQRSIVRSVGSDQEVRINTRIIAACNRPLEPLVQKDRFRPDLYHRLNVVKLRLPPLRERGEDLHALLPEFARRHSHIYPGVNSVDPDLVQFLRSQPFRGNVRELEHTVERMLFCKMEGNSLTYADWLAQCSEAGCESEGGDLLTHAANTVWSDICERGLKYTDALRQLDKKLLETALRSGGQTRRELATRLRTSERTLYYKLRAHKLNRRLPE
jgi:transcriptional regulator with PAS, ATPase and Fis domain